MSDVSTSFLSRLTEGFLPLIAATAASVPAASDSATPFVLYRCQREMGSGLARRHRLLQIGRAVFVGLECGLMSRHAGPLEIVRQRAERAQHGRVAVDSRRISSYQQLARPGQWAKTAVG